MGMMTAQASQSDLGVLADLMHSEKITTVIDRTYPLSEIRKAIRYLETGRARGKVILTIAQEDYSASAAADAGIVEAPSRNQ